ncbi:MAG: Rrf2 family transcriptional regulator [Candidatus Zixiibacteriota bacterium]|nr:MAG: Rrf2 family transcriptional regulator [candidate division Zixibacteria bacterium]
MTITVVDFWSLFSYNGTKQNGCTGIQLSHGRARRWWEQPKRGKQPMKLSRKADYALRAVRHLSTLPKGKLGSINSIAAAESIPREFLAKILKDLTRGGILVSFQGVTGGYRLARPAKDISFLDVIESIEGPIHINLCTEPNGCGCDQVDDCQMHDFWVAQENQFKKSLGRHTFGRYARARR